MTRTPRLILVIIPIAVMACDSDDRNNNHNKSINNAETDGSIDSEGRTETEDPEKENGNGETDAATETNNSFDDRGQADIEGWESEDGDSETEAQDDVEYPVAELPLTDEGTIDISGGAWRLIEVPTLPHGPSVIQTPIGWLSLSWCSLGNSKAPTGSLSALYRSKDGVRWESLPLEGAGDELALSDIAYGAGRYVAVGVRDGVGGVIRSSDDGFVWREFEQNSEYIHTWRRVVFAGDLFFALGSSLLGVSKDGENWSRAAIASPQPMNAALGNGRYVLVGSGPIEVSEDGLVWRASDLDCTLPGACLTDPSGDVHQGVQSHILFEEGRFFSDQLTSVDALEWQALPGRFPSAYLSGHFLSGGDALSAWIRVGYQLSAWTTDGIEQSIPVVRPSEASVTLEDRESTSIGVIRELPPIPDRVDVSFEDGLDCAKATCVIVDDRLYLVPPSGTPALPNRLP